MKKNEEIEAINIQLITLLVVLVSTIISITITYNQKLNMEDKDTIFNSKESLNITLFNRILIVIISFVFL
jgi:cell division protein FtsL